MKAPNGNPTHLTERQWVMVRTPSFKKWFGDWEADPESASKIIDENGEPLVVYHATNDDFTVFDPNIRGEYSGFSWFSDDPNYGRDWLSNLDSNARVMSCFLNVRNPHDALSRYSGDSIIEMTDDDGRKASAEELKNLSEDSGLSVEEIKRRYKDHVVFDLTQSALMRRALEGKGHDGYFLNEYGLRTIGVMNPESIKSATNNNGVFFTQSKNINE